MSYASLSGPYRECRITFLMAYFTIDAWKGVFDALTDLSINTNVELEPVYGGKLVATFSIYEARIPRAHQVFDELVKSQTVQSGYLIEA